CGFLLPAIFGGDDFAHRVALHIEVVCQGKPLALIDAVSIYPPVAGGYLRIAIAVIDGESFHCFNLVRLVGRYIVLRASVRRSIRQAPRTDKGRGTSLPHGYGG